MTYDPQHHHRRSIRLRGYDYTQAGAYFVTDCADKRECLFGDVVDVRVRLSPVGDLVVACWSAIPDHFSDAELDAFVVMPNHLHGILVIEAPAAAEVGISRARVPAERATHASLLRNRAPRGPKRRSLSAIVGSFKAAVTRQAADHRGADGSLWQRNFSEHAIRNDRDLDRIRTYIEANPSRWDEDAENPFRLPS